MFFKETIDDARKYMKPSSNSEINNLKNKIDIPLISDKLISDKLISDKLDDSLYKPHQKDSLFWCFFILMHGSSAYEMIGNKHFTVEKNEKIKLVELVRDKKALLKQYKITPLSSVEDELTNSMAISIGTFFAICIASNIEFLYINKSNNTYFALFEETPGPSDTINVLYKSEASTRFECDAHGESSLISSTEKTHFKLFSIDKPIRPISAYKSHELLEICKKMGIDVCAGGATQNKQRLYNALQHKLN